MNFIFKKTISGESGGTINNVINRHNNLDFLILGASRAKHGIDPKYLTALGNDGFNLGINGTSILNSLLVLDILIQNNAKPKTVVVQADLFEFVKGFDPYVSEQAKKVYPYDTELIREYVRNAGKVEQVKYFFETYRLNRKILNVAVNFFKRNTINIGNGYVGLTNTTAVPDDISVSGDYVYDSGGVHAESVKKIKKLADENNIKLIIVFPPFYKNVSYNKLEQKRIDDDFTNSGITVIDMSDVEKYKELEGIENWRDSFHFNSVGAEKFSILLNEEIKKRNTGR